MKEPTRVTRGSVVSFGSSAERLPLCFEQRGQLTVGIGAHRAELDHPEAFAVAANPLLPVEDPRPGSRP